MIETNGVEWKNYGEKQVEILLVEDNPNDEELAIISLKNNNIANKIQVARDGAEALEYLFGSVDGKTLRNTHPIILLLDIKLPKIDGLEVLKRVKQHPIAKNIPVVILTSSLEEKDMIEAYRLGVNSYIRKPVDFEQFSEAVRQIGAYWLILNEQPFQHYESMESLQKELK
ncbi:MAG: response regulator [Thermoplasmatota archaeon]